MHNAHSKIEVSRHNKGRSIEIEQGHVRGGSHNRSWWRSIYQRVSQSAGEDEQEKYLSPHPKRKSVSRSKDAVRALPLIKEMPPPGAGYPYEDPPPPSALNAYLSGGFADDERRIPRKGSPRAPPFTPNFVYLSPESAKPKANHPVQLGRSDSLLGRVFTNLGSDVHATNTDLDHATESQPSRPTSLWRAGSANPVPKHVPAEMSTVTQANVSDGIDPQPVTPVRGEVGTGGIPSRDEETSTPPPRRSHIRDTADPVVTPPPSPLPQQSPLVADHPSVRHDSLVNSPLVPRPPGIPGSSAGHDFSSHSLAEFEPQRPDQRGPANSGAIYPFPVPDPQLLLPPQQRPAAGPRSPQVPERLRRASCNEALLRPFPEPIHHPLPNMGPTKFTPPRSKLTIPAPLAKPLPRGSGSLKRNRTNTLPAPEQYTLPNEEPRRESRSRRHTQLALPPPDAHGPHFGPHSPKPSSRNPHRRTSYPLSVLQETSHPYMNTPSSPPHRSSRRLSSPLMSSPPSRPTRSNAVHRKSPGSRSPPQITSPRANLLAELRGAPTTDSDDFSRYPVPGSGSGISSPTRTSRTRLSPSPRTPPFVNAHMLPSPTSSPRSDTEEWASAVSSLPPSVRTKR